MILGLGVCAKFPLGFHESGRRNSRSELKRGAMATFHCPVAVEKSLTANVGINANNSCDMVRRVCLPLGHIPFYGAKQIGLGSSLRDAHSGPEISSARTRVWCGSRSHSHKSTGFFRTPNRIAEEKVLEVRVGDGEKYSRSSNCPEFVFPTASIGHEQWRPEDLDLTRSNLKGWFGSICSSIIGLLLCVPQAYGAMPVTGDLALIDCGNAETSYASLKGLDGESLKTNLHDLVKGHKVFRYIEVWDALKVLDEVEDDPNSVIDIYSLKKMAKSQQGTTDGWNREHLWPRSFGLEMGPAFTDLHNLRPSDMNVNSSRGNKPYGDCSTPEARQCLIPANKEAGPDTGTNVDFWMPPAKMRGDIARALMYMAVRYGIDQPSGSPQLTLSDSPSVERARMGILSDLLRWNEADPPSDMERRRNSKVCSLYQGNRNPFVDHPEYATAIWGDSPVLPPDTPVPPPQPSPSGTNNIAWINELHYENVGTDEGEFVEVVVGPNVDPASLKVVLYNGGNGDVYRVLALTDNTIFSRGDDVGSGFKIFVARVVLQNGPSDGLAIIREPTRGAPEVVQFLTYEGTLRASDGPAKGELSADIGVEETSTTPLRSSLGLTGSGNLYEAFRWSVFSTRASPGTLNPGQTLVR